MAGRSGGGGLRRLGRGCRDAESRPAGDFDRLDGGAVPRRHDGARGFTAAASFDPDRDAWVARVRAPRRLAAAPGESGVPGVRLSCRADLELAGHFVLELFDFVAEAQQPRPLGGERRQRDSEAPPVEIEMWSQPDGIAPAVVEREERLPLFDAGVSRELRQRLPGERDGFASAQGVGREWRSHRDRSALEAAVATRGPGLCGIRRAEEHGGQGGEKDDPSRHSPRSTPPPCGGRRPRAGRRTSPSSSASRSSASGWLPPPPCRWCRRRARRRTAAGRRPRRSACR